MGLLRRAAQRAGQEAGTTGAEGVRALEREVNRRRDEACFEAARHGAAADRLEEIKAKRKVKFGLRIRIAWRRLLGGRAEDSCIAQEAVEKEQ